MSSNSDGPSGAPVRRQFDTDAVDANVSVVEVVADLENADVAELPPLYACIDHLLERLFSNPPAGDADAVVAFTYHGYRITVTQDGDARFEAAD